MSGTDVRDLTLFLMQLWADDQKVDERLVAALAALRGGQLVERRSYAMSVVSARCLEVFIRLC